MQLEESGCEVHYTDKPGDSRQELDRLLAEAKQGDVVHVTELRQLGKTASSVLRTVELLNSKGAKVVSAGDEVRLDPSSFRILLAMQEKEQQEKISKMRQGRREARERGVKFGRKTGLTKKNQQIAPDVFAMYHKGEHSTEQVRVAFGIGSRTTLYSILAYHLKSITDDYNKKKSDTGGLKLFYVHIIRNLKKAVTELSYIIEIDGKEQVRQSVMIDDKGPGQNLEAVNELTNSLEGFISSAFSTERFVIVGYHSQTIAIPFLQNAFFQAGRSLEAYFYPNSFDISVLAMHYMRFDLPKIKDTGLETIYKSLVGLFAAKRPTKKQEEQPAPDAESIRKIYKLIAPDEITQQEVLTPR